MKIKRDKLYDYISSMCDNEYTIGLHGISKYALKRIGINGNSSAAANNIINNGLIIYSSRTLNGTVEFMGRIDLKKDEERLRNRLEHYCYADAEDYIVVGIPTVLRTNKNNQLFIGSPNKRSKYKEYMGTRGGEHTTLAEYAIPKEYGFDSIIPSEYILGKFRVIDKDTIDFSFNPNHICFKNHLASEETLEKAKRKITTPLYFSMSKLRMDLLKLPLSENERKEIEKTILLEKENLFSSPRDTFSSKDDTAAIIETLEQLQKEETLEKRKPSTVVYDEEKKEIDIDDKIIVELSYGEYFTYGEHYQVKFEYKSEEEERKIFNAFETEILPSVGNRSIRSLKYNQEPILPYLNETGGIGGTSIPYYLLRDMIKRLVEYDKCIVKVEDIVMEYEFNEETFIKMMNRLNGNNKIK